MVRSPAVAVRSRLSLKGNYSNSKKLKCSLPPTQVAVDLLDFSIRQCLRQFDFQRNYALFCYVIDNYSIVCLPCRVFLLIDKFYLIHGQIGFSLICTTQFLNCVSRWSLLLNQHKTTYKVITAKTLCSIYIYRLVALACKILRYH